MPMNRYEIRDEYSLADPELYRAADKDDPEALLEGVAMAGMVGVLRQLGDLAEFAAEIFHDLHEEVMATAVRGHSLMIRVQQLEVEVPSVEKALLSQTDLSSVFYNTGVDWHANIQLEQNLVTQGDFPRFVMDSYEECRGPPRLFLLDKFDVAGAGACLKRYTDPSFFKLESSATATANVQREKKIRKAKKKGPHARYGGTPETLQESSHAKLHQLLLKECVENGVGKPAYRARLKRRPYAFPFSLKSGKSYMEELLKNPSPEHKLLHGVTVSSPLRMSMDDQNESVLELRSVSPGRESEGSKSDSPFADKEEILPKSSSNQRNDALTDIRTYGVSSLINILTDDIPSVSDEETSGKDIAIYGESKMEGSSIGYQSDEVASEIDNFVDAPSTMESEMDTDSELKVKNKFTSYRKNQPQASLKNEARSNSLSLDSQSTGDFSISDEGNNSYKKEISSFLFSDTPRTSAENPQIEKLSADGFPSADVPEFVLVNSSSIERTPQHSRADNASKPVRSNNTLCGNDSAPENRPDFEQPTCSSSSSTKSGPTLPHYDSRTVAVEGTLRGAKSDETFSNSDEDEEKRDLISDSQCSPSASHSKSLKDDSQRPSSGEHLRGEIPWRSPYAAISHHTSDSLDAISAHSVREDDSDQKDLNQFQNIPSTVNTDNNIYEHRIDTEVILSKENPIPGKLDKKVAKLTENFANDYIEIAHNGDNVASEVSEGDERDLSSDCYYEDPNVVSETLDSEEHCSNQISTGTLTWPGISQTPILLEEGLVTHEGPTAINGTSKLGCPKTSEVMGLQIGITDDVNPSGLSAPENSFCMPEKLDDSSGISYTTERDGINLDSGIAEVEHSEVSSSTCLKLPNQMTESLDELDPSTNQSENARIACSTPAVSDNTILGNVSSPSGLNILVEEHVPCFQDLGLGVLEDHATSLSGLNRESEVEEEEGSDISGSRSDLVEDVDDREAAALDFVAVCETKHDDLGQGVLEDHATSLSGLKRESGVEEEEGGDISGSRSELVEEVDDREAAALGFVAVCETKHDDDLKREGSHTDFGSRIDSEAVDMVNASQIPTPLEQSGLDAEDDSFHQSSLENIVSDVDSLHITSVAEESVLPENIELHSAAIEDTLPDIEIISSELSSAFPTTQLQMLDHDNDKGFDNFTSSFPPPDYSPSVPALPGLQNYGTDASAYPKDPSGLTFPLGNFPPETNQMNLHKSPSLPPLPPLQWRIGKPQHASSTTEVEKMEIKEVFPEAIFPPEISTGNVSSVPEHWKYSRIQKMVGLPQKLENEQDQVQLQPQPLQQLLNPTMEKEVPSPAEEVEVAEGSQMVILPRNPSSTTEVQKMEIKEVFPEAIVPPGITTGNVSSVPGHMKESPVQKMVGLLQKIENEQDQVQLQPQPQPQPQPQQQLLNPTMDKEVPSPAVEVEVEVAEGSQMVKLPIQIVPQSTLKEEGDNMDQAVHPLPEVETPQQKQQLHLVLPIEECVVPSPAVEDGVAKGYRTIKLPRTCNPVIGSVAALDKSRLRKVTEQVGPQKQKQEVATYLHLRKVTEQDRPQKQKQEGRDALLDQIRAKSFNLKPAATTKPSSIPGPNTNLKVAAILEKANAIRQALAGSDEDDEDNWSDS
ncbi:protein SCAR2-like isoform X1 [Salvia splendens]|uniref:protein SCAR2-like isoform X1 n=1 Tax=Salvia splendens TaxID=180675 RepID=UPI001C280806|nr:protein SCAR2-like isoform X1 [Salvia splendens]